eukprot:TRINITY_DN71510_c0_g1_i1.p1 TRINITY_DN71510_c0_g1~~TRINITY_DN71510_c0_g1_i1.p1  ORF type:complete len:149 (-),score=17.65 TRINITY_DN71510_c0_g1_i1:47-493(-)
MVLTRRIVLCTVSIACSSVVGYPNRSDALVSHMMRRQRGIRAHALTAIQQVHESDPLPEKPWRAISLTKSCEEHWYILSPQGVVFAECALSLSECKIRCERTTNCVAIDYYQKTGCCNGQAKACTEKEASSTHDKASSYSMSDGSFYR